MSKKYEDLRSARWMAPDDFRSFGHRSRAMQMGYGPEDWEGRPVIAVINTWSEAQPCHTHFKGRVEWVKRGIHLLAMARRAGVDWGLEDLDRIGHDVPVIANIRPKSTAHKRKRFGGYEPQ